MAKKQSEYLASLARRTALENAQKEGRVMRVTGYHTGDFVACVIELLPAGGETRRSVRMKVTRVLSGELEVGAEIEVPFNKAVHFTSL